MEKGTGKGKDTTKYTYQGKDQGKAKSRPR